MVYTHMIFAAGFDRWVFGHHMGVVSLLGCGLILGGAMWAALGKKKAAVKREERGARDVERLDDGEEGVPMLASMLTGEEGREEGVVELEMSPGRGRLSSGL